MSVKNKSVGTKAVLEKKSIDCLDSVRQVLREVEERQANLEFQLALALHSQRTEEVYQMLDDLSSVDKVELARVRQLVQESIQATEKEVQEQVAEKLRTKASTSFCSFGIKESSKERKQISGNKVMPGATRKDTKSLVTRNIQTSRFKPEKFVKEKPPMVRPVSNADHANRQHFIDIISATGGAQPPQLNPYHNQYTLFPQETIFNTVPEQETLGFSRRLVNLSPETGLPHQTRSHVLGEYFPCAIPLGPPIQKRSPGLVIDQTNSVIIPSSSEKRQLQEKNKVGVVNIFSGIPKLEENSKQLITQVLPNINIEGRKPITTPSNLRKENVKVVRFVEVDDKPSEIIPHELSGFPSSYVNLPKSGFLSQGQQSVQTSSHNLQSHELLKNYSTWRRDPELIARIISQLSTASSCEISVPTLSEHPISHKGEINRDTVEKILVELIKEELQNSSSSSEKLSPENEEENYSYTSIENHSLERANTSSSSVKEPLSCTLEKLKDTNPSVAIQTSIQESQARVLTPEASDQTVLSSGKSQSPSLTTKTFPPVSTPERSPPQTTSQMMPDHPSTPSPSPPPPPLNTELVAEKSESSSSCLGVNVQDAAVQYSQDNTVCDSTFATTTDSTDDPISEGELLIKKTERITGVENGEFCSTFQDDQVSHDHPLSEGEVQPSSLNVQILQDPVSKVLRRLSDSNGENGFRKNWKKEVWRELSSGEIRGTEIAMSILKETGEVDISQGEFPLVNLGRNVGHSFRSILSEGEIAAATGDSQLPVEEMECFFDEPAPKSDEHIRKVYDLTKSDVNNDSLRQDYDELDDEPVKDVTSTFSEGQLLGSEVESLWDISQSEIRNGTAISSTSISSES